MSDEDLIRRGDVVKATAEYLWETQVDPMLLWYVEQAVLTIPAAAPDKVAKAVEVLNALDATLDRNGWHVDSIAREDIRTTLAEIKGESQDGMV
jgi:hypothetical protein